MDAVKIIVDVCEVLRGQIGRRATVDEKRNPFVTKLGVNAMPTTITVIAKISFIFCFSID